MTEWLDLDNARNWSDEEIKDYFDSTDVTLAQLERMTGHSVADLKKILMGGRA